MNKGLTQDMFESIDWQPLKERISDKIGVPIELDVKLDTNWRGNFVCFQSQDLVDKTGVLSSTLRHLYVKEFGGGYVAEEDQCWMSIHFVYEFTNGGCNGHNLFDACYCFGTRTWKIIDRYTV